MRPIVVVTGLRREGAMLREPGVRLVAGGGSAERLSLLLDGELRDAAAVISFGMAGALDPALALGNWVIGDRLCGAFQGGCDRRWIAALSHCLPDAHVGPIHADGRMIVAAEEKRALGARCGALAVDMESHIVGRAAASARLPFAVLRCVSDDVDMPVPPAIAVSMRPDGGLAVGAVLGSLIARPGQLPALIQAIMRFRRAFAELKLGAAACGRRLAFDRRAPSEDDR